MIKKVILVLFVLLLTGCFIWYLQNTSQTKRTEAEKQQEMESLLGHGVRQEKSAPTGEGTYRGTGITFSYPASFSLYTYGKDPAQTPTALHLQDRDTHTYFNYEARTLPSVHSFSDIPDVAVRENQKDVYTEKKMTMGKEDAIVFEKTSDSFEETGFVLRNGTIYSFSVTSMQQQSVEDGFKSITSSVVFH